MEWPENSKTPALRREPAVGCFSGLRALRRLWCGGDLLGCQNQVQGVAFLPRTKLHQALVFHILDQPLQNFAAQALAGHFPAPEKDGGLHLVAFIQEAQHVVLFGLIVVLVHVDAELHFLDGDGFLVLFGLALLLFLLVEKFAVIHDAANRRLGSGRDLHQVKILGTGHLERLERRHDADLLAFVVNHAHFAGANALIHADKTLVDTNLRPLRAGKMQNYSMQAIDFRPQAKANSGAETSPSSSPPLTLSMRALSHWLGA